MKNYFQVHAIPASMIDWTCITRQQRVGPIPIDQSIRLGYILAAQLDRNDYDAMTENEGTKEISVHYIGPSVENGRIDLFVLSDGLRGLVLQL